MSKYMSNEFFQELVAALSTDTKWAESIKGLKTSILWTVTDTGTSNLLSVDQGTTSAQASPQGATPEFTFEGTYDAWCKVGKGEVDIQSAVMRGQLKFKGSITKVMMYRDKLMRVDEVIKNMQKEF